MQNKSVPGPGPIVALAIEHLTMLMPAEHVHAALAFVATELHEEAYRRDVQMLAQHILGVPEQEIAAYREATADIRDLAERWDFELAVGDAR